MAQRSGLYRAFGIDFQSALPLPEMRVAAWGAAETPVVIEQGPASCPAAGVEIARDVVVGPGIFWMDVPNVARFRVEDGRRMIVELAPGASESAARAFLLGSALGALLHQRGALPIHASAVEIDGRAYAFVGHSGAGKSTLALALTQRGHRLLSDDIMAVELQAGVPVCWPGLTNVKLWGDTLAVLGRGPGGLEQVLPSVDKYRLPLTARTALADEGPVPLGGVFGLCKRVGASEATVAPMPGAEAAALLIANTFRGQLVGPMNRRRVHFDQCVTVASHVPVQRIERPWDVARLDACCALIEQVATT